MVPSLRLIFGYGFKPARTNKRFQPECISDYGTWALAFEMKAEDGNYNSDVTAVFLGHSHWPAGQKGVPQLLATRFQLASDPVVI